MINKNARKEFGKYSEKIGISALHQLPIKQAEVVEMFGKRHSEENDCIDFFKRFDFINYPDWMGDFSDK